MLACEATPYPWSGFFQRWLLARARPSSWKWLSRVWSGLSACRQWWGTACPPFVEIRLNNNQRRAKKSNINRRRQLARSCHLSFSATLCATRASRCLFLHKRSRLRFTLFYEILSTVTIWKTIDNPASSRKRRIIALSPYRRLQNIINAALVIRKLRDFRCWLLPVNFTV